MKLSNLSPKGKWIHIKINGYTYKKYIAGYDNLTLPEVKSIEDLNLNAHEEAMIHLKDHTGENLNPGEFNYIINTRVLSSTGGTTSLSGSSISIAENMSLSFSIYPQTSYYISSCTINNVTQTLATPSASTVITMSNITQDKNIAVGFSRYGA